MSAASSTARTRCSSGYAGPAARARLRRRRRTSAAFPSTTRPARARPRDAFASLDSLDFHETFVHTRCDMIRAGDARERSGATVAVADLARLDDLAHPDDPARVDEGNPRFLPWEVRLSVRALSNDAKPGAAGRELCEGVLDLARFARRHPDAAAHPRSSGSRTAPARPWTSACDRPPVRSDPQRRATRTRATSSRRARRKIPSRARRPPRRSFRSFLHPRRRLARARRARGRRFFHAVVASRRLGLGFGVFAP